METLHNIFAAFDITSLFSSVFPLFIKSFERFFSILYSYLISGLTEVIEKLPVFLPVIVFLSFYFLLTFVVGLRKQVVRVKK